MKLFIALAAAFFCISTASVAQNKKPVINHIALYVYKLDASAAFYKNIIGLDTIPEPFHDGKHVWLAIGGSAALHLIEGAQAVMAHDKNSHTCFSVPDIDAFISHLNKNNIEFEDWSGKKGAFAKRPDGVKQIYFKDPDGYWIEINDAKN